MSIATIVLAGGLSSRMGTPKPGLVRDGVPLLRAVVLASPGERVVVGPPVLAELGLDGARLAREDPPGGGPVAGLAAGLAALDPSADQVQVLACDLPHAAEIVAALDRAAWPPERDALVPLDSAGWPQYLAGRYRRGALERVLAGDVRDVSVRRTLGGVDRVEVPMPDAVLVDVDDPQAAAAQGWFPPSR